MQDDYANPLFNAYSNLSLPGFRAMPKHASDATSGNFDKALMESLRPSYQLHVMRIPVEITEEGIYNIFSKYGRAIKIDLAKPNPMQVILACRCPLSKVNLYFQARNPEYKTWARVTFPTLEEAQRAMENLHLKAPHFLIVNHAISREEKEKQRQEDQNLANESDVVLAKMMAFQKTRGIGHLDPEARMSERARQVTSVAASYAMPRIQHGTRGLSPYHLQK